MSIYKSYSSAIVLEVTHYAHQDLSSMPREYELSTMQWCRNNHSQFSVAQQNLSSLQGRLLLSELWWNRHSIEIKFVPDLPQFLSLTSEQNIA
jgi:hypothetical protein